MPDEDEWIDAEEIADDVAEKSGQPIRRSPEQGIAVMQKRIYRLRGLHDQVAAEPASVNQAERLLSIMRDLLKAETRLKEYEIQLKGRN